MSFLRKRSRSQSSGSNGEEDRYSVRSDRKELNERSLVERRYSGVSEMSSRPDDYGFHDSCVYVHLATNFQHVLIEAPVSEISQSTSHPTCASSLGSPTPGSMTTNPSPTMRDGHVPCYGAARSLPIRKPC